MPGRQEALPRLVDRLLETLPPKVKVILVDMHAEATSEKQAMGWYLDGRVAAVVGTHTHVQTADERILPGGQIRNERNPHLLNDSKAKRLASYLKSLLPGAAANTVPFIAAVTVLHGQGSTVDLDATGRANTYGLDGFQVVGVPSLSEWLADAPGQPDQATNTKVTKLLREAGFSPTPRQRMVGPYVIEGDPVATGRFDVALG